MDRLLIERTDVRNTVADWLAEQGLDVEANPSTVEAVVEELMEEADHQLDWNHGKPTMEDVAEQAIDIADDWLATNYPKPTL